VDLQDCCSMSSLRDKISEHLVKYPDLPHIVGINWDQTKLTAYPTKSDIDGLDTDKPVNAVQCIHHINLTFAFFFKSEFYFMLCSASPRYFCGELVGTLDSQIAKHWLLQIYVAET
jgi:hypothetical protein